MTLLQVDLTVFTDRFRIKKANPRSNTSLSGLPLQISNKSSCAIYFLLRPFVPVPPQVPFTCSSTPAGTTMCGERSPPRCTTSLWASCGLTRSVCKHFSLVTIQPQLQTSNPAIIPLTFQGAYRYFFPPVIQNCVVHSRKAFQHMNKELHNL